ncbi:DUF6388 family protein [Kushneria aurantia]|uniref:DUF6388 family protein n=1 Tax=Kushneria aurantia TaxID=504092 RepID=A0ABV6G605_9GAMM|nr:DUF6388 family protein [Kushneria aurantia]
MGYSEEAKSRFLASNEEVRKRIDDIPEARADALGVSKRELQDLDLMRAMEKAAERRGQDLGEFMIELGTDTEEEANQIRLDRAKRRASALGLSWEEFVELNPPWEGYN